MRNFFSLTPSISIWPSLGSYRLAPVEEKDWEPIRLWRNAQLSILRQNQPLSPQEQQRYWKGQSTQSPLESKNFCFVYKEKGQTIGYGGFVHIDFENACAELSSLLDSAFAEPSPLFLKTSEIFLNLSQELAWQLGLQTLSAEAYDHRLEFIHLLYKIGFTDAIYKNARKTWKDVTYGSWQMYLYSPLLKGS